MTPKVTTTSKLVGSSGSTWAAYSTESNQWQGIWVRIRHVQVSYTFILLLRCSFVFLFWLSGKFTFTFTGTGNIEAYEWAYLLSEVCLSCLLLLLLSFAKYFVSRVGLVLMSDFTFTFLGKRMRTNEWANLLVLLLSSAQESGLMGGPAYCARLTSPDLFYFHLQVLNRRVQWVD